MTTKQIIDVNADADTPPPGICSDCFARNVMEHKPLAVVAVHCEHGAAGAWRVRNDALWTVYAPITAQDFATRLKAMFGLAGAQLRYERGNAPEH